MGLRNKDLISIHDLSVGEVATILDVAKKLKRKQKNGEPHQYLKGKTLGMIFSKASTRTRVSFEVGFWQLGGHPIYLNDSASQIGRGEPVRDTARVLSRFVDGIMIRTFSHESVLELAKYASIPVINGLTDMLHPCQALTDLFTIMEYKEVLKGRKLVYVGDGNNMAHSLMYACAKVGMNMVCACPQGYQPDPVIVKTAQEDAVHTGCTIEVDDDLFRASKGADVLYTDVWASMGQESEQSIRQEALGEYQINKELFDIQAMHTSENAELLKQENRLESIRKEMYALDKQINELQGKYTKAMEENYQLERRKIEQDEKRKYMLQVADKQARQKELRAMLEEARFEYQDRHQRLMQTQQDLNNRRNIVNDLKTKISKARYESDQANNILIQLQNRRQVLENMKSLKICFLKILILKKKSR